MRSKIDFSKEDLSEMDLGGLQRLPSESESDFELRKLFLKNSKIVNCWKCGNSWRILKSRRRPAKRLIPRRCPYCNPLGVTISLGL